MAINLLYHDVTRAGQDDVSGFAGPGAARYKLTDDEFERHLDAIAKVVQQKTLTSTDPGELGTASGHSWMITFDDGGISASTEIAERLERRGWRGWFFITTDYIGKPAFCSPDQLRDLHRRGHVIGSHSCSHPERISDCSWERLVSEWSQSCQVLQEIIGTPTTTASVPGGFYSPQVARAARQAGVEILFNSEPTTAAARAEGLLILGRYNVYRGMSAADAASLVSSPLRRWRQAAFWNVKKVAKICAGPVYKRIRQRLLADAYAAPSAKRSTH